MKITEQTLARRVELLSEPDAGATVIDRIRYLITFLRKTQAQFGRLIDVDPTNVSKLLSGKMPITDRIINRIVVNLGVSKRWLTEGTDVPFPRAADEHVRSINRETADVGDVGAPVYDIDVTAGAQELARMFTDDRIIGRLNMPSVDPSHPIVRVSGDSMTPRIPNNSWIQIRPISDIAPIFWGSIYVVVMDDYRMVKQLRRHPDSNKVILHSFNPEYDDMEIDRLDIRKLFLVEIIFNYDIVS